MALVPVPRPDLIDVSENQPPRYIDWPRVGAAGIVAAYVRAGEGTHRDPCCAAHTDGARSIGRPSGVYWAWHPDVGPEVQAEWLAEAHHTVGAELAPLVDCELDGGLPPIELARRLGAMLARLDTCLPTGTRGAIYTGPGWWSGRFRADLGAPFRDRMLMVAHYGTATPDIPWPWDEYAIWQAAGNTIWSDGSFGPVPKDPAAHRVALPGVVDGAADDHGQPIEIDVDVLGNTSLGALAEGTQPQSQLDLTTPLGRQRALRRVGVDPGHLDGAWGPASRAALILAQRRLGLTPTGMWGEGEDVAFSEVARARVP